MLTACLWLKCITHVTHLSRWSPAWTFCRELFLLAQQTPRLYLFKLSCFYSTRSSTYLSPGALLPPILHLSILFYPLRSRHPHSLLYGFTSLCREYDNCNIFDARMYQSLTKRELLQCWHIYSLENSFATRPFVYKQFSTGQQVAWQQIHFQPCLRRWVAKPSRFAKLSLRPFLKAAR